MSYDLTNFWIIEGKSNFPSNDLLYVKKIYVKDLAKNFLDKFDEIKKLEGPSNFKNSCLIIFLRKQILKTINGLTEKTQSVILCFPPKADKKLMTSFSELLNEKVRERIIAEKDPFKIQDLCSFSNMGVYYWSDYFLGGTNEEKKQFLRTKERFLNINDYGIAYSEKDVKFQVIKYLASASTKYKPFR